MRLWLVLLIIFTVGLLGISTLENVYRVQIDEDNNQRLILETEFAEDRITSNIQSGLNALESLKAFMLATPDLPNFATFDEFSEELLKTYPFVRTFQYVDTDRIIRHMYPLVGNEEALNLDLTTRPAAPFVEAAILERKTNVNNPNITVQGSLSVVARTPLYQDDEFLGLVQVVIDIDSIIESSFGDLSSDFTFQLTDSTERIFWGEEQLQSPLQSTRIDIADTFWTLNVAWHEAPSPSSLVLGIIRLGGLGFVISLLLVIQQTWHNIGRLNREVESRTRALAEKNQQLLDEITERRQLEKDLLESELRFYRIFHASPVATVITNLDNSQRFIDLNDKMLELTGFERHEMLGRSSKELNLFAQPTVRSHLMEITNNKGGYINFQMQIRTKAGEIRDIILSTDTITLNGENHAITMAYDITEWKQYERAFLESQERLSLAVTSANVGLWDWDLHSNEVHYSLRWKQQIGYEDHEISNDFSEWENRVHPEDIEVAKSRVEDYLANPSPRFQNEFRFKHKDSSYRWILAQASLIYDEQGQAIRMLGSHIDITERKLAEEALRISEERLRLSTEIANIAVWEYDLIKNEMSRSSNHDALYGLASQEKWVIDTFLNATHPDDREMSNQIIQDSIRYGGSNRYSFDFRVIWPDKSVHWLSVTGEVAARDMQGTATLIRGVLLDITKRKDAEEKMRVSEQLFSNAFHVGPAGMTITRIADGIFINANETFCEMFEYERDEVIGHTSVELKMWTLEERQKLIQQQLATGGLHNFELVAQSKSGRQIYILFSSKEIQVSGEPCLLTTIIDITERKQAEEEVRKLSRAVEQSANTIIITDSNGHIEYVNPHFTETSGYTSAEAIGRKPNILKSGYTPPKEYKLLWDTISSGNEWSGEFHNKKKNGELYWESVLITPIKDTDGVIRHYLAIKEDITERKQVEDERKQLIVELESKNAEMERFTYTVSHDLKSPLITIRSYAEILEEDIQQGDTENIDYDINYIRNAAEKMQELLDSLLELSRIGRVTNPSENIDLDLLLHNVIILLNTPLADKGVDVIINEDMPTVFGDRIRLGEVFQNLIENAIKFMGNQANPQIQIGASIKDAEVLVYVRDNGLGIHPDYHSKIFGLFEKLEANNEGTGIGLALVKQIIEYHGGNIWVESEGIGHGSTFYFTLKSPSNSK